MDEEDYMYDDYNEIDPDEYEAMLEQEEEVTFGTPISQGRTVSVQPDSNEHTENYTSTQNSLTTQEPGCNEQTQNFTSTQKFSTTQIVDSNITNYSNAINNNSKKRTLEDVFGDIDDILFEEQTRKKKKNNKEAELELIARISQLRNLNREQFLLSNTYNKVNPTNKRYADKNLANVSNIVPRWPFISIKNSSGEKLYVRFHSETYINEEIASIANKDDYKGLIADKFKTIWEDAQKIVAKMYANEKNVEPMTANNEEIIDDSLWVDYYKPRKYVELLSDEGINRTLLHWLQLWDHICFNRPKRVVKPKPVKESFNENKWKKKEIELKLDEDGRPEFKVALLCGPPGLGKTTLAHMVAKHAGYNVVELNASDDRSIEAFRNALENATQMKSVIDRERRPNCLILDEIDGAPNATIDFLIKFVNGTPKTSKKNTKKLLNRPIICICNDVYAVSLRNLRSIAFIIHFPPTASSRLSERLMEITKQQNLKTDISTMLALCEKTQNDIRACLSVLHFYKSQSKPVRLIDIQNSNIGQKDVQKNLFTVWQEIFQIQRIKSDDMEQKGIINMIPTVRRRMKDILKTVSSFGEYDRLILGVFENYPNIQMRDYHLENVSEALEWFTFSDILNKSIYGCNNFQLLQYMPYGFVIWHLLFANLTRPKLIYPNADYQAFKKSQEIQIIIKDLFNEHDGISPSLRIFIQPLTLILDLVTYLLLIISPEMKAVNINVLNAESKEQLERVVNIMIDYNLNYVQERDENGTYKYRLDPNIDKLVEFNDKECDYLKQLSYSGKQLIAHQIELEKLKRIKEKELAPLNKSYYENRTENTEMSSTPVRTQSHLMKLQPKALTDKKAASKKVRRNFFGQIITEAEEEVLKQKEKSKISKGDIWYHYKEGYNNAVRKAITIDYFL